MKRSNLIRPVLILGAGGLLLGFLLRLYVLGHSLDDAGFFARGSHALTWTLVFCVLFAAALAVLLLGGNRLPGGERHLGGSSAALLCQLVGGLLLSFGSLFRLLTGVGEGLPRYLAMGGVVAGLCMAAAGVFGPRLQKKTFLLRFLTAVYATARVLINFQTWTQDPLVLDYLPPFLSALSAMVGTTYLCGFTLEAGRRRSAAFWGILCPFFAVMFLPDVLFYSRGALPELLICLGMALYCLAGSLALLRPWVQDEEPAAEDPEPEAGPERAEAPAPAGSERAEEEA